jgi:hypothetical protein
MALAVAGLRYDGTTDTASTTSIDVVRVTGGRSTELGQVTTVKDNRQGSSEAKSNSLSSVLNGKLSPERESGR